MYLYLGTATLLAILAATFYTLKVAKPITVMTRVVQLVAAFGLPRLLQKTGLSKYTKPKPSEICSPDGHRMIIPVPMMKITLLEILKLKVRDDDVFLVTYPKAGSTWLQEIAWLLCNNADVDAAKRTAVTARVPFLEAVDFDANMKGFQTAENWPYTKERLMKTHVPYEFLPDELRSGRRCKIVYLARNPKDLCVSAYFFQKMNFGLPDTGTWNEYVEDFCNDRTGLGGWFGHVLTYWTRYQENDRRIYFATYEALKRDLRAELVPMAKFLGKNLTEEQMDAIAQHCSFDSMSENPNVNYTKIAKMGLDFSVSKFMRKGQVGDWKNYFTLNQNEAFDALYKRRMKGSGLNISFEI